ncbi:aspartate aminotransferase family protein [Haladaptatus halobius]|uniref:aspartate aminotransferase family protein n=1 Tax=Haladaptatus halobius TaxID=2884875 RepID=UPI001D0A2559|nr:aspartate aminotransferase family protein [Haladaptatus halobius]
MSREFDILDRDSDVLSEAMKIRFFPFVLDRQAGATLTSVDGDELIDFTSAWAVANTGYRHPTVVDALRNQLDRALANSPISLPHGSVVQLAERLRDRLDAGYPTKVWFGHSGSEAGDLLSKAIPTTGDGDVVVNFEGSYHGITAGAAAISGHSAQAGVESEDVVTLPFPDQYRSYLDPDALADTALEAVAEAFETHDIAGLITEPLQSDGGILVPPDGFLEGLADLCTDNDAYFVVDEVKAGLGRTGEFFAFEHADVEPDAIMLGKPLGSGVPISAVVGRAELVDYEPASHMMTTAGGPLSAAAGLATLDVIEAENLSKRAARLGDHLSDVLADLAADSPVVGDVRGRGMMQGVELVEAGTDDPSHDLAARVCLWARRRGLAVFYVGLHSNVLELTPPLTISKTDLDTGVDRLAGAIEDAQTKTLDPALLERYAGW